MEPTPNRLAVAIVQTDDVPDLVERLDGAGFGSTRIDAAGGFLRQENAVLLVAAHEGRVPALLESIRQVCRRRMVVWFPPMPDAVSGMPTEPIEVEIGGAVVFVLPLERIEYLGVEDSPDASTGTEVMREAVSLGR